MKINIVNPNTTASMTAKIGDCARQAASPGTEIQACNPASGPVSIEGHYDEAMCLPGLLAEIRRAENAGADAHIIACFGDPGLDAAREIARGPVFGIAEAAMHAASFVGKHFSIVTTLGRTRSIAAHLAERYGMQRFCRNIRACEIAVLELENPASQAYASIMQECRLALAKDDVDCIVLGCAGMADLCQAIGKELGVPVIDGVSAAVTFAEGLVRLGLHTSKRGDWNYPLPKQYL
ncbi:aspartate/glutamate racemase family protein [Herbaspirillum sp. RV1423]|uniref:aspartate/glutamate racemase family protein n=1 Tax=Herbaspirillum sp. RV1423 TaxID=1443993 RepID=UPI0004B02769|nr:aspartate/glutamate racemase family protein [Herbaspirillum sp. RV1423]